MTKDEIILANREFLFPAVFHYYKDPLVVSRAKDQYVWDADGNQYLDYIGSWGPLILGHAHPRVTAAVIEAVRRAGPGKVIFGSDGPQLHPGVELRKVELLELPPRAQALVTGGTILRLLGPGSAVTKTPAQVMPPRVRR